MHVSAVPPARVLAAFGAAGPPRPLPGGAGTSWVADGVVFKPDADARVQQWIGRSLSGLPQHGFRLAPAVATLDEHWVCEGWSAARWVSGVELNHQTERQWAQIIEAGRAFHRAAAHLPRPDFIGDRSNEWEVADRAAWSTTPPDVCPELALVAKRLFAVPEPLGKPQVVHGDLTGNVLVAPGTPPAIIDISPYWRPPAYAEGVVVADALCWHAAPAILASDLGVPVEGVARALLFRLLTTQERVRVTADADDLNEEARRYTHAADAIGV